MPKQALFSEKSSRNSDSISPMKAHPQATPQLLQRAQADPQSLTHAEVMILQRTVGNRATTELLQPLLQKKPSPQPDAQPTWVQRFVMAGNKRDNPSKIFDRFKAAKPEVYQIAQSQTPTGEALMSDEAILAAIKPFVTDTQQHYLANIYEKLEREIETRQADAQFAPTQDEQGVQVQVLGTNHTLPSPLDVANMDKGENEPKIDLHPQNHIMFKPKLAVRVPKTEQGQWEVGLIQTLMSSHRRLRIINPRQIRTLRIDVDQPHIDKRPGPNPWYDATRGRQALTQDFELINDLLLDDKPGYSQNKYVSTDRVLDSTGQDTFKTWLILRHTSGTHVKYLAQWNWQLNYDTDDPNAGATGGVAAVNGADAKLDGKRAKEDIGFASQTINIRQMPTAGDYRDMKEKATKQMTLGSGMLPKKVYNERLMKFQRCFENGDLPAAIAELQFIQTEFSRMNDKGNSYWQSPKLKQLHFTPLFDTVNHILRQLQSL